MLNRKSFSQLPRMLGSCKEKRRLWGSFMDPSYSQELGVFFLFFAPSFAHTAALQEVIFEHGRSWKEMQAQDR